MLMQAGTIAMHALVNPSASHRLSNVSKRLMAYIVVA